MERAAVDCPICHAPMSRETFKGVPIDACEAHGIWLDSGELETILKKREHTLKMKYRRELGQANHDGKISGILLGWLSLFVDRKSPL
jgi:Zn-finger nucleic acid-binding protein